MRKYLAISILLILSVVCFANNDKVEHFMNISAEVPKSMMISEIPSWGLENPHVISDPNDPNQVIRKREIDYTMTWLRKTINQDILNNKIDVEVLRDNFRLISDLGKNKDDALMVSFEVDPFDITIVDGRFLALSVCVTNEAQVDIVDIEEVFKKVVKYWGYADKYRVKVNIETLSAKDSNDSWGKINVDQGRATGWYENVEWYKVGNELIFAFNKVVEPPVSKISWKAEDAPRFWGGIPIEDKRRFLRFENSNREELSKEYFLKKK